MKRMSALVIPANLSKIISGRNDRRRITVIKTNVGFESNINSVRATTCNACNKITSKQKVTAVLAIVPIWFL